MNILPPTNELAKAGFTVLQRYKGVEYPKKSTLLFPDLARIPISNDLPFLTSTTQGKTTVNPTLLEEAKSKIIKYGFTWFHLPYQKEEEVSIVEELQHYFKQYATALCNYFQISNRAKVKIKDWMSGGSKGNFDFHQDYPHKKALLTLVYGDRANIHGGSFEIRNKSLEDIYRIPALNGRVSVITFRDNEYLFHRGLPRKLIHRQEKPNRTPEHHLLAVRGFQKDDNRPFTYGTE